MQRAKRLQMKERKWKLFGSGKPNSPGASAQPRYKWRSRLLGNRAPGPRRRPARGHQGHVDAAREFLGQLAVDESTAVQQYEKHLRETYQREGLARPWRNSTVMGYARRFRKRLGAIVIR